MEVKFVIWGAGARGRRCAEFIGLHRIKAFIDSNSVLAGTECIGKPVISIDEYLTLYKECILIISPREHQSIVNTLKSKNFISYLMLDDCPSEIFMGQIDSIQDIPLPQIDYSKAAVYGGSLYSLLLWERLEACGIHIPMVLKNDQIELLSLFSHISKDVYLIKNICSAFPFDILLQTVKEAPEIKRSRVVDLYNLHVCTNMFCHQELSRFKNMHEGQRCFIIATGPSLRMKDLDILHKKGEVCIGVNGIFKAFNDTEWRPDYYIISDHARLVDWKQDILAMNTKEKFIADFAWVFNEDEIRDNIHEWHLHFSWAESQNLSFSDDFSRVSYWGRTIVYDGALQLAAYMGFKEIYLLGTDCTQTSGEKVKHFVEDYLPEPCTMDVDNVMRAYQAAKRYADTHGIKIYNATRGGYLEVFPRVDFDELMGRGGEYI